MTTNILFIEFFICFIYCNFLFSFTSAWCFMFSLWKSTSSGTLTVLSSSSIPKNSRCCTSCSFSGNFFSHINQFLNKINPALKMRTRNSVISYDKADNNEHIHQLLDISFLLLVQLVGKTQSFTNKFYSQTQEAIYSIHYELHYLS